MPVQTTKIKVQAHAPAEDLPQPAKKSHKKGAAQWFSFQQVPHLSHPGNTIWPGFDFQGLLKNDVLLDVSCDTLDHSLVAAPSL